MGFSIKLLFLLLCCFLRNTIRAKYQWKGEWRYVTLCRFDLIGGDSGLPFELRRRQFPVRLCYGMTINKSQSQTLDRVGVYLREEVFGHGQLYVAFSRVGRRDRLFVCFDDGKEMEDGFWTRNIVYKEAL